MFAPLPLVVVDDLADQLEERHYEPGARGRRRRVGRGSATTWSPRAPRQWRSTAAPRRTLGPGDGFGEIALLRDVPRTATVTAQTALTTLSLERNAFLFAVTMNQASRAQVEALVAGRLAEDPAGLSPRAPEASGS